MYKFLSIICVALFLSATVAEKSKTEQAAETAAQIKDKIVETVKDAANTAYDTVSPKVAEGTEYIKDKSADGVEYLKDKAQEAYDAGSKHASEYADVGKYLGMLINKFLFDILAKEKLAKVADDVKVSAQNFAADSAKLSQEYAQEGLEQGRKLGEQAFEVGKDKANEALKAAKKSDAYEASLEYGADGIKKGRKLAEQTVELGRDKELADALHQLAVTQGAVSEIELDNPRVGDAWLDFVIGYDDAGSAKKVINLLEAFNNVQPLTHIRVIEYTPPPNPQPQLIV
ncbi:unnamed protein product [Rotaria sp. Silwood2]|nr:unnamed protein product [Rotaria sp. Silwood2]